MKLYFIGDIHGQLDRYYSILDSLEEDACSIQIGDLCFGYENKPMLKKLDQRHRFIRGNHDHPEISAEHPNYLGDYGYIEEWDLFYLSGAYSPNYRRLQQYINWWPTEQLSYTKFAEAIRLYDEVKPKYVCTHDAPKTISKQMGYGNNNITQTALELMSEMHAPEQWIFGHYHRKATFKKDGTKYRCVPCHDTYYVEN